MYIAIYGRVCVRTSTSADAAAEQHFFFHMIGASVNNTEAVSRVEGIIALPQKFHGLTIYFSFILNSIMVVFSYTLNFL